MYLPNPADRHPSKWDTMPIPTGGFGRIRYVLTTHFSKLIQANLLFILFSLPVITIPVSFAAMTAVVQELFRKGHCHVWHTFFQEFRTEPVARTLLSLLLLALPVGGWFLGAPFSSWMPYAFSAMLAGSRAVDRLLLVPADGIPHNPQHPLPAQCMSVGCAGKPAQPLFASDYMRNRRADRPFLAVQRTGRIPVPSCYDATAGRRCCQPCAG